ncbi:HNH endonuclease [Morganella morganii]
MTVAQQRQRQWTTSPRKLMGGTDAESNLQSLCWPCHYHKTATERNRG